MHPLPASIGAASESFPAQFGEGLVHVGRNMSPGVGWGRTHVCARKPDRHRSLSLPPSEGNAQRKLAQQTATRLLLQDAHLVTSVSLHHQPL